MFAVGGDDAPEGGHDGREPEGREPVVGRVDAEAAGGGVGVAPGGQRPTDPRAPEVGGEPHHPGGHNQRHQVVGHGRAAGQRLHPLGAAQHDEPAGEPLGPRPPEQRGGHHHPEERQGGEAQPPPRPEGGDADHHGEGQGGQSGEGHGGEVREPRPDAQITHDVGADPGEGDLAQRHLARPARDDHDGGADQEDGDPPGPGLEGDVGRECRDPDCESQGQADQPDAADPR